MRFHHFFSLPLLAVARKYGFTEIQHIGGVKAAYHDFARFRPLAVLYRYLLLIDTFIATMVNVYPRLALGRTVVCDRFVYDTLVDLMVSTGDSGIPDYFTTKLLLSLAADSRTVVMMVDQQGLRRRRQDLSHDRNLELKVQLYNAFSIRFGLPILWADGSVIDVHNALLNILDSGSD